jgi:hypothetical protein
LRFFSLFLFQLQPLKTQGNYSFLLDQESSDPHLKSNSSFIHHRGAAYQTGMQCSLLAKKETTCNFASNFAISERARFFYMPQNWDMGQIILHSLRRKACCGFFRRKNPMASAGREPAIFFFIVP